MSEELKQAAQQATKQAPVLSDGEVRHYATCCVTTEDAIRAAEQKVLERALTQRPAAQADVQQRLFQLLNGAAGDGLVINDIDAAELFTDLFPEHIEFITRGGVSPTQPAQAGEADERQVLWESFVKWWAGSTFAPDTSATLKNQMKHAAWAAALWLTDQRASLLAQPAAQATPDHVPGVGKMMQATPEPVGEAVAWLVSLPEEPELGEWFSEEDMIEQGYTSKPLFTRPAAGVPDFANLLKVKEVDWAEDIDHATKLEARAEGWNECREEVLRLLAAAQAKGGAA